MNLMFWNKIKPARKNFNLPFECESCETAIEILAKRFIPIPINNKELIESEEYDS